MKAPVGAVTYYVLVGSQTLSWMGSQTSSLAVGIAVFRLTGHACRRSPSSASSQPLPWIVLGGLGGALADRFDRRSLMLVANLGYALASGLLLLAFVSGSFRIWELYALTVANGVFGVLEGPALQASVAMLVPDRHRDRANAIQELSYPSAVVIAAALAGLLYAAFGVVGAIAVNMSTFAVAVAVLAVIRIPMPATSAEGRAAAGGLWRQSFGGFRYLAGRPALLTLCLYISLVGATAGGFFWALMTPYVLDRVHATTTFGVVYGIGFSGGDRSSALAMAAWGGTRPRIHTVMVSTLLAGAGVALTGAARTSILLAGSMFLLTFADPLRQCGDKLDLPGSGGARHARPRVRRHGPVQRAARAARQSYGGAARGPRLRACCRQTRLARRRLGGGRRARQRHRTDVRDRWPLDRGPHSRRLRGPGGPAGRVGPARSRTATPALAR